MRDQGQDRWMWGGRELLHEAGAIRTSLMNEADLLEGPCTKCTRMMKMPFQQQAGYEMEDVL